MAGVGVNGGYGPWLTGTASPPGPLTWPAGQTWPLRNPGRVYAADLNQQLSLPVAFLSAKPMFQGTQASFQAIQPGKFTPITLDTETSDAWGMHSTDSDTSVVTVPNGYGGIYLVQGSIPYSTAVNGSVFEADIWNGGSPYTKGERWGAAGSHVTPGVADLLDLAVGETVQLVGYQGTGATLNTYVINDSAPYTSAAFPQLTMRWVADDAGLGGLTPPSPGTWSAGTMTSAQCNSDIRNSVLWLSCVPYCRADTVTGTVVPSGTLTTVTGWSTLNLQNYPAFSGSTWTAPFAGVYLMCAQVAFGLTNSVFDANAGLSITSGTTTTYYGSKARGNNIASMLLRTFRLNAGDTAQVVAFQNSGSSNTTQTGSNTRFFSLWVSK